MHGYNELDLKGQIKCESTSITIGVMGGKSHHLTPAYKPHSFRTAFIWHRKLCNIIRCHSKFRIGT